MNDLPDIRNRITRYSAADGSVLRYRCGPKTHRSPSRKQYERGSVAVGLTAYPKRHKCGNVGAVSICWQRGGVEVAHSWFNRFRRLLVRWEKKAANYLAFAQLAALLIVYRKLRHARSLSG